MNVLVFDIETIPDIEGGQRIYNLQGLDEKSTAKALFHITKQKTGSDFLPLHLQKIIAISVVYRGMGEDMGHEVSVRSLGDSTSSEADLLNEFFQQIEACTPTLVSWNGTAFDLPVKHYRSLKNSVSAPGYWGQGEANPAFGQDHYLSRYHNRHTDLKDVLASYQDAAKAPLSHIASLLGFPGKDDMDDSFTADGSDTADGSLTADGSVWEEYLAGNLKGIRNCCDTNVLNTYLVYLRYQLMRCKMGRNDIQQEYDLLRKMLDHSGQAHLQAFSKHWAK